MADEPLLASQEDQFSYINEPPVATASHYPQPPGGGGRSKSASTGGYTPSSHQFMTSVTVANASSTAGASSGGGGGGGGSSNQHPPRQMRTNGSHHNRSAAHASKSRSLVLHTGGWCLYLPPVLLVLITIIILTIAVMILVPSAHFPSRTESPHTHRALHAVAFVLIPGSVLVPCFLVYFTSWLQAPSRSTRLKQSFYYDSLLQQMLTGDIAEHYSVEGEQHVANGTVVLMAGAAAHRGLSMLYSSQLAQQYRTICVDLPSQGSLFAVSFSLSRCERVLRRVLEKEAPSDKVLLLGHGAFSYVAMHMVQRMPERLAGICCVGEIPRYPTSRRCSLISWYESPYRLLWYRHLVNNSYKGQIERSSLPRHLRQVATRDDFNLEARPQMMAELRGEPLLARLSRFERPVLFLCPKHTMDKIRRDVTLPSDTTRVRELSVGATLPPLSSSDLRQLTSEMTSFAATLDLKRRELPEAEKRRAGSWTSFSSFSSNPSRDAPRLLSPPMSPLSRVPESGRK